MLSSYRFNDRGSGSFGDVVFRERIVSKEMGEPSTVSIHRSVVCLMIKVFVIMAYVIRTIALLILKMVIMCHQNMSTILTHGKRVPVNLKRKM